jgi:RNA polymerase sigma-70 factor, ECF subfamily
VFLKAFESLDGFREDAALSTWLHRIAVNRCLDLLRKRKRLAEQSWDALIEQDGDALAARLEAREPDPHQALEDADLAARVLARLPEAQRVALVLRETAGLSYDEIAQALGCSVDSVKARLRRARAEIDQKLRHLSGPENV